MTDPLPIDAAPRAAYEHFVNSQRRHQAQRGIGVTLGKFPKWEDLAPDMKIIWMACHAAPPIQLRGSSVEDLLIPLVAGLFQQLCQLRHELNQMRAPELARPLELSAADLAAIMSAPSAPSENPDA